MNTYTYKKRRGILKSRGRGTKRLGGDIHKHNVFKHIISVGYELETSSLSKLTLVYPKTGMDENPFLMNTDTARKDLDILQKKNGEEDGEEFELDDKWALRQEEDMEINAYDRYKKVDKNVSFLITNDIVESPFVKFLGRTCAKIEEEQAFFSENFVKTELKNKMYKFQETNGKKYDIQFVFHDDEVPCGVFSDVEWILTYYKPPRARNILIDTFANVVLNLLYHLRDLELIPGSIRINTCAGSSPQIKEPDIPFIGVGGDSIRSESKRSESKKSEMEICEIVAKKPEKRILFHKPGTNLYYLQSHYFEKEMTIKDACITPQMTFSAHISNVVPIMKALVKDTIRSIPTSMEILDERFKTLNHIDFCVELLLKGYNETETTYKIINSSGDKTIYKSIRAYMFLILYKLFLFYNIYLQKKDTKYFKDALFFNSRHSNYILYQSLKEKIRIYFFGGFGGVGGFGGEEGQESEEGEEDSEEDRIEQTCIDIIQRLFVQKSILEKHLIEDIKFVRKNAFSIYNRIGKGSSSYGNPANSLISYFDFFENPYEYKNVDIEGEIIYHDWLEYKRIDAFSSKMDLKSDIVLIEFRAFTRVLSSYIYSILDTENKKKMTHGICNQMTRNYKADVKGISISVLEDFYRHYQDSLKKKK